jgi:hypothetical protein
MEERQVSAPPTRLAYTAWFRNLLMEPDDQDFEWVAIFVIVANTADAAHAWGDHLAKSCSSRNPDELFLCSDVKALDDPIWSGVTKSWHECPLVHFGHEAADEEIGW